MRRLLLVLLLIGISFGVAATALWPGHTPSWAASGTGASPVALQFFRNPESIDRFVVRDLRGGRIDSADLEGKVLIVNFWATWCPPCRAELPTLIALQAKYGDQLQIVGVSEDDISPAQVEDFTRAQGFNYPVVMNSATLSKTFTGVTALPTSFIVDRDGRVVQKHVGVLDADRVDAEVRELAGLPVHEAVERIDRPADPEVDVTSAQPAADGVDLSGLSPSAKAEALREMRSTKCPCGCNLSVADCTCAASLPIARAIVAKLRAR